MDWNGLQFLLALAQYKTLPRAAEALGVNRTTVSRRIEQMETDLEVRLVDKVGRELTLTTAGQEAVSAAELIEGEVQSLQRSVLGRDQQFSGEIRVTLTQGIGCLLAPYLARFQSEYPDILLDLHVTNAWEDLQLLESDVALRFTTHPPEQLIGRLIARPKMAIYAGRDLADRMAEVEEFDFVGTYVTGEIPDLGAGKKMRRMIYTNSIDVAKELVAAGRGVTQIPCYMAEEDPRLVRISATQSDPLPEIWLLYHPRLRSQPRIRKFTEYLMACFEELKPAIEAG